MTIRIIVAVAATIIAGLTTFSSISAAATPDIRNGGNSVVTEVQKPGPIGGVNRGAGASAEDHSFDVRADTSAKTLDTSRPTHPETSPSS